MLKIEPKQTSFHTSLYNKIPENHILKVIDKAVNFSFINEMLADTYSKRMGRPAKEPELMCKLLILQHLYNLSDEKVIQESSLNLSHLYFLGLNPEDKLPDESLLAKFRCHRLSEVSLDDIITEVIRQCVEHGIIKGDSVSVDATHIQANTIKKTPEHFMKHMARKIISSHQKNEETYESLLQEPDYEEIKDHHEAKSTMKSYLEAVIDEVKEKECTEKTKELIKEAKEILADPKFIKQKGIRSLIDKDARVGHKSKTQSFYGYKYEYVMTTEENIIAAVHIADGAYIDGNEMKSLLERTVAGGVNIKEVYADKAYFRKPILESIEGIKAKAYIPVSGIVYRMDETKFTYNKDADEWSCHQGATTIHKKYYKTKRDEGYREGYRYSFLKEDCEKCNFREECAGKKAKKKVLSVGLNTGEFYSMSQEQKDDTFKEKYHKRASIESKNAEQKRFHDLDRAKGYGLRSVSTQAKLTALAVNLKTISRIVVKKTTDFKKKIGDYCKRNILLFIILMKELFELEKRGLFQWSRTVLLAQ